MSVGEAGQMTSRILAVQSGVRGRCWVLTVQSGVGGQMQVGKGEGLGREDGAASGRGHILER